MLPVFAEMFEVMAEMIFVKGKKGTQFFSWVTGSPENKESFAGLHATKVVLFVDEASALPGEIFDTLYGTLSSGDTSFVLVSNPVRAEGAFYKLFQIPDYESKWKRITFTSFGSPNVDKDWIEEMRAYYGEDHDFWKMRVMGEFPIMSEAQYIPTDAVEGAMARVISPQEYINYPRVMGVDVARFGDDCSIIVDRQGPKILDIKHFKGLDTIQFAEQVMSYYTQNLRAFSCVAVDGIGVGAGVVDQLRRYDGIPLMEVQTSVQAPDFKTYANTRAQLWGEMKSWLVTADIPKDDELREQLVSINYGYNSKMQVLLESKKDMKRRGKTSPDKADAIALTFAPSIFSFVQAKRRPKVIRQTKYRWV